MSPLVLAISESAAAEWLVRTSWQAVVLIAIVAAVQAACGALLAPRWRYALWMLVVVRLLMPVLPTTSWSVFNLAIPQPEKKTVIRANEPAKPQATDGVSVTVVRTFETGADPASVEPPTVISRPARFDWRRAMIAVWLAGALLLVLRVVVAHVLLTRRLRCAPTAEAGVLALLDDCRRAMRLRAHVPVIATDAVGGPALFGFFRPRLLVPPAMLRKLSHDDLRFVFLHELAHIKRRDTLLAVPLSLAAALHWFNPFVWFALSRCRFERELACDALVLGMTDAPGGPRGYGQTMLRLAEALCARRRQGFLSPAALGILETRSQLTRRIAMISTFRRGSSSSRRWSVLPALLLVTVASCTLTDKPASAPAGSATPPPAADQSVELDTATVADPHKNITLADPAKEAANAAARELLAKRLPELKIDNAPFVDVIDALRDLTNANIFVNWRALEAEGIDRDAPVTARLLDVKFSKALEVILADLGGGVVRLGYTIDDGVITISTKDDLFSNTLTRVYDIRDLITVFPDSTPFAAVGADHARPKPTSQPATQSQEDLVEQVSVLIRDTIEPDLWREAGGSVASMRDLAGQLIIGATPEMHAAISQLLDQIREGRGLQVVVETRFVTIEPAALDRALGERFRGTLGRSGVASVWQLSDDEVQTVLRATRDAPDASIVTAPRLTLFNGQRGYVNVSTQTAYVSGFMIFKTDGSETRYEPKISVAESGVMLDVTATASADRQYATLTLKPKLSRLAALRVAPYMDSKDLTIQVPEMIVHELQTTLTVPDRGTALIGGFTESASQAIAALTADSLTATLVGGGQIQLHDAARTKVQIPEGGKVTIEGQPVRVTQGRGSATRPSLSNLYLLVKPTLIVTQPQEQ